MKHTLRAFILVSLLCLLAAPTAQAAKPLNLRILQWNIWQEGTSVKGGFDAIVNELLRLRPDFVTLSEVRNYHNVNFTRRLCDTLRARGLTYYSFRSYDTGLLSRYPIKDSLTIFPCNGDHGSIYKLTANVKGRNIHVYTAHLDYQNDAYYNVRGYDGSTWKECALPADLPELLRLNDLSWRDDATRIFLNEARHDTEQGGIVILGGDFNEPSWQDWTEATKDLYDHHGFIVPWTVTKLLTDNGFVDAFRAFRPDPLTDPGFTYPSHNPDVSISRLTWAPKADERERIDYIFFRGKAVTVTNAQVFGPNQSICRSRPTTDPDADRILPPLATWPTDHKGLLVELSIR